MRWLILTCLVPFAAQAKDLHIDVDYVLKQERVRPSPKIVTPTIEHHFMLHENGSVDEQFHTGGPFPENHKASSKLGEDLRVIDSRTIKKSWPVGAQTRVLTITTDGAACNATLDIKNGAGEFKSFSTDLNTTALYRNSSVVSTRCKIE